MTPGELTRTHRHDRLGLAALGDRAMHRFRVSSRTLMKPKHLPLVLLLSFAAQGAAMAYSPQQSSALEGLMNLRPSQQGESLSPVRESILRSGAQALGTQTGLIDGANEVLRAIDDFAPEMDRTFRFGDLVLGQGVLPPVIVASHGDASIAEDGAMMRVAGSVYRLEQPARFVTGAPSWRDWLLMGLPSGLDYPELPDNPQLLPRDDQEKAYWQRQVLESYKKGREHALLTFDNNLAELERVYVGMRTFYELYARGMVSMPTLASVQDTVNRTGPNTIVVGDTVFQITVPADFNTDPAAWRATQSQAHPERALLEQTRQDRAQEARPETPVGPQPWSDNARSHSPTVAPINATVSHAISRPAASSPISGAQAWAIRDAAVSQIRMHSAPMPESGARHTPLYPGASADHTWQAAPRAAQAPQGAATYTTETVGPGETLYTIAARTGVHWQELLRMNGLGPESVMMIQPGMILRVDGPR